MSETTITIIPEPTQAPIQTSFETLQLVMRGRHPSVKADSLDVLTGTYIDEPEKPSTLTLLLGRLRLTTPIILQDQEIAKQLRDIPCNKSQWNQVPNFIQRAVEMDPGNSQFHLMLTRITGITIPSGTVKLQEIKDLITRNWNGVSKLAGVRTAPAPAPAPTARRPRGPSLSYEMFLQRNNSGWCRFSCRENSDWTADIPLGEILDMCEDASTIDDVLESVESYAEEGWQNADIDWEEHDVEYYDYEYNGSEDDESTFDADPRQRRAALIDFLEEHAPPEVLRRLGL